MRFIDISRIFLNSQDGSCSAYFLVLPSPSPSGAVLPFLVPPSIPIREIARCQGLPQKMILLNIEKLENALHREPSLDTRNIPGLRYRSTALDSIIVKT